MATVLIIRTFFSLAFTAVSASAIAASPADTFTENVEPFLNRYCYDCHGFYTTKGSLDLMEFTSLEGAQADRHTWDKLARNLEFDIMPPPNGGLHPPSAERDEVVAYIYEHVLRPDCTEAVNPGRETIRRLNRTEYNNTIQDLTGLDISPADTFPEDDSGYGFDNNADVLTVAPVLMERYLEAAETTLDAALVIPPPEPYVRSLPAVDFAGGVLMEGDTDTRGIYSAEATSIRARLESAGNYILRFNGYAEKAGPADPEVSIRVNNEEIDKVEVRAPQQSPQPYEFRLRLDAGIKRFDFEFTNDFYDTAGPPGRTDRNVFIQEVTLEGPFDPPAPEASESHRRIFFDRPSGVDDETYVRAVLNRFASRAWRRNATEAELERLMGMYSAIRPESLSLEEAARFPLTAVLVSPKFIFREEPMPEGVRPGQVYRIDEFALAARLSYFLWSSMPDDELFRLASRGELRKNLEAQVYRMLRDPRAARLAGDFAAQWLMFRNLRIASPDPGRFPEWSADLRDAMRTETELLFKHIHWRNRPVTELLTADYTFVNEVLASHYGIPDIRGSRFRKVFYGDIPRRGLLNHASVLTITSNPTRTSPVKRGLYVLDTILGKAPPPAPPVVPDLPEGEAIEAKLSLKERMVQHREDPNCSSCHAVMDPIGFGFEHFDAIGAFRWRDGVNDLETAGAFWTGEPFRDHLELVDAMVNAKEELFIRNMINNMLTFALGRGATFDDACSVDDIYGRMSANNMRFNSLVYGIVMSDAFQYRRAPGEPPEVAAR